MKSNFTSLTHCDGQDCLKHAGGHHTEVCIIRDSEGIAVDHNSATCECVKHSKVTSDKEAMLAAAEHIRMCNEAEDKAYKFTNFRSTHDLARKLLEQPETVCLTWNTGIDGTNPVSADFRTKDIWIVNGEDIYEHDPHGLWNKPVSIEKVIAIIIE